jgi:hypothetical protein
MNERNIQGKVRQALDHSVSRMDQATLARLGAARGMAMQRFDAHQAAPAYAWAGLSSRFGFASGARRRLYYWLAALLLVAAAVNGIAYWQQHVQDNDDVEADIAILTDDMPIDVYLD